MKILSRKTTEQTCGSRPSLTYGSRTESMQKIKIS